MATTKEDALTSAPVIFEDNRTVVEGHDRQVIHADVPPIVCENRRIVHDNRRIVHDDRPIIHHDLSILRRDRPVVLGNKFSKLQTEKEAPFSFQREVSKVDIC